jgi:hypothetical protein
MPKKYHPVQYRQRGNHFKLSVPNTEELLGIKELIRRIWLRARIMLYRVLTPL